MAHTQSPALRRPGSAQTLNSPKESLSNAPSQQPPGKHCRQGLHQVRRSGTGHLFLARPRSPAATGHQASALGCSHGGIFTGSFMPTLTQPHGAPCSRPSASGRRPRDTRSEHPTCAFVFPQITDRLLKVKDTHSRDAGRCPQNLGQSCPAPSQQDES